MTALGGRSGLYLLLFAAGAVVAARLPSLPDQEWMIVAGAIALAGLVHPRSRAWMVPLLGALWFLAHAHWHMEHQWPAERAGETRTLTGRIAAPPEWRNQSLRFEFIPDAGSADERLPGRILVGWFRPSEYLRPGERWRLTLRLDPPHGRDNPHGFDYQRYLLARGIGARASVTGAARRLDPGAARGAVDRQRQRLAEILQAENTDADAAALKRALGLADRSGMSEELSATLRRTGTAHLLAISGLHVGMVALIAGVVGGWLLAPLVLAGRGLDRRRIMIVCGLVSALAYAALAGFTLPTQRALVMLAVAGGALLLRRGLGPARALLLALVAVLLFDPLAPLATGFWLSFSAVAVLVWTFAWRPGDSTGWRGWIVSLARAQLVIAIGLLPLNAGLFQQFVPVALVANLVAIPLVGMWILPALLAEIGGILLGLPTAWPAQIAATGLGVLVDFLARLDQAGFGHATVAGGGLVALLVAMAGVFWLLAPPGWPARWLGAVLLLPLFLPRGEAPGEAELELWLLDAGAGQAALIRTGSDTLLFDTGPGDGQGGDAIGAHLPPLLADAGIDRLDRVVVSAAHSGHAGGLGSVRARVDADDLRVAPGLDGPPCIAGERWSAGSWRFRFLHPSPGLPDLGGNSSCVLHVTGPGGSLLISGPIDARVESRLLDHYPGLETDVLVLAGGGHRRAASSEWLAALQPVRALSASDRLDRWQRPHGEVRQRLAENGIPLTDTGRCGALRLRLRPGHAPGLRSMATLRPRFWKTRAGCP